MRARALLVSTATTALVLTGSAGVASAHPNGQAEALLRQEIADQRYNPPAWITDPANQRGAVRPYDVKDVILGVTFVVGLVVLW